MTGSSRIIVADVLDGLKTLDDGSVQCCVTSPPYWGLRDYGVEGQLGLEPTPAEFVERLVGVFAAVRRVLRPDGVVFVNLGDSYACSPKGNKNNDKSGLHGIHESKSYGDRILTKDNRNKAKVPGLRPKSLVGIPSRFALAMQDDGWIWRSMMPWVKRSAMPESVRDRPASAIEYWLMFTQQERYFWDAEGVRKGQACDRMRGPADHPCKDTNGNSGLGRREPTGTRSYRNTDLFYESLTAPHGLITDADGHPLALDVNPQSFSEAHFATFPEKLVQPLIQAGSRDDSTVLDPFCGSGTTLLVANRLGRDAVGIELSADYAAMAEKRIGQGLRPSTYVDQTTSPEGTLWE